jgi:hypothetical protein
MKIDLNDVSSKNTKHLIHANQIDINDSPVKLCDNLDLKSNNESFKVDVSNESSKVALSNESSKVALSNESSKVALSNESSKVALSNESSKVAVSNESYNVSLTNESSNMSVANTLNLINTSTNDISDIDSSSSNKVTTPVENSKYDHNKKLELVKKINKIKKKEYLIHIFKIITFNNKDYTENKNGVFIFFHNLSDEIYEKLEIYVNYIYKLHNKSSNNTNSDSLNSINISDLIELSISDINKNLSNKEKVLLKRRNYENYITFNQH